MRQVREHPLGKGFPTICRPRVGGFEQSGTPKSGARHIKSLDAGSVLPREDYSETIAQPEISAKVPSGCFHKDAFFSKSFQYDGIVSTRQILLLLTAVDRPVAATDGA